jgi:hypothetical protein
MKLAAPLPVSGLACGSSVRLTENRRLFGLPPGLSSRNNHQARRELNRRGLSETFSVTSVIPRHAGSTLKAGVSCASKFLSSTTGSPVQGETFSRGGDWQSATTFSSLHCSSRTRMAFSRVLQPQSEKSPNSSIVTLVLIRIFRIVGVSRNVLYVISGVHSSCAECTRSSVRVINVKDYNQSARAAKAAYAGRGGL